MQPLLLKQAILQSMKHYLRVAFCAWKYLVVLIFLLCSLLKRFPFCPTWYIQIEMLTTLKMAYYPSLHTFE